MDGTTSMVEAKSPAAAPTSVDTSGSLSQGVVAYPLAPVDRYGFLLSDKRFAQSPTHGKTKKEDLHDRLWLENRRTQKWMAMTGKGSYEEWHSLQLKHASKLKSRIRKGIPEALRGLAWPHLTGASALMRNHPGMYRDLLATPHIPCEETISRDIGRTFPKHHLFKDAQSIGQGALSNILKAYSVYDPDVGYCQGMGFISALFLSYMPEEQTFWQLVACLNQKKFGLADLYRPGMPRVVEVIAIFDACVRLYLPALARHLDAEGLHPTMFATQWFVTLFAYSFPFELVTRVWDVFLHEGWKIVYRVAVALLKLSEKALLAKKFEKIMEFFKELPTLVDTKQVLSAAWDLPITTAQLQSLHDKERKGTAWTLGWRSRSKGNACEREMVERGEWTRRLSSASSTSSGGLYEREALLEELTELAEKEDLLHALVGRASPRMMSSKSESDSDDATAAIDVSPTVPKKPLPPPCEPIHNHWNLFQDAKDMSPFRDLAHLCLAQQGLRNEDFALVCHNLPAFMALRSMDVSNNQLDDGCCSQLRTVLTSRRPLLTGLDISSNLLGDSAFQLLCDRLATANSLAWLAVHGNPLARSATAVHRLRDALYMNESLGSLAITLTDASPPLALNFVRGLGFHSQHLREAPLGGRPWLKRLALTALSLAYAELSPKTVEALAGVVAQQPQLTALDLSFCFIGIAGARTLAAALAVPTCPLVAINLKCNLVGSPGAKVLAAALCTNQALTMLNLDKNEIANDGILALAGVLPKLALLTHLDLTHNHLQQAGLKALANAIAASPQLMSVGSLDHLVPRASVHLAADCSAVAAALSANALGALRDATHVPPGPRKSSTKRGQANAWTELWAIDVAMDARMCLTWHFHAAVASPQPQVAIDRVMWRAVLRRHCDLHDAPEEVLEEGHLDLEPRTCDDRAGLTCIGVVYKHAMTAFAAAQDRLSIEYLAVARDPSLQVDFCVQDFGEEHHHVDERHLYFKAPAAREVAFREAAYWRQRDHYHSKEACVQAIPLHCDGTFRLLFELRLIPLVDCFAPELLKLKLLRSKSWSSSAAETILEVSKAYSKAKMT
ncbi:hypothetical protein ACHHYP_07166 [Achlya hypogyna]|uniref:Rab-GAP TBC domain-containing protein n=1 Tax=Achlya hypogyna TaxID=1202772 RepID=A0A1V9ZMJ4_ACHHY|nr:hypothetical protein ACHHYP_07166 [Achlya hypogyna]